MVSVGVASTEINDRTSGNYRAGLDCTYVQADLARHSPQNPWSLTTE